MEYSELVKVYEQLESTSKRLEKTRIIADFISRIRESDLSSVLLLLQGRVFPFWNEANIGVAAKLVVKAIHASTGLSTSQIEKEWKETGDLGITAQKCIARKKQATLFKGTLSVSKVFTNIRKLAEVGGIGSVDGKIQLISELLTSSSPEEGRYIVRTLMEDLRVGTGEGILRDAILWAFFSEELKISLKDGELEIEDRPKYNEYAGAVQRAYDLTNDFSLVTEICRKDGLKGLLGQSMIVGKPVKVMLALKAKNAQDGLDMVGMPAQAEYKLDGFRMQVHKHEKIIKLFTRRLEDVTKQFPDVVKAIEEGISAESCILDSEAVGYEIGTGKYLPFQNISQRIRRKYDIEEIAGKFPVELNIFDVIYLNGKSMLDMTFKERRKTLGKILKKKSKGAVIVKGITVKSADEIDKFFKEAIEKGTEGLMLKSFDSPYQPGARVGHMVKLKQTMENLDLAIIGAEWGEGKRASWLSSYTLACKDNGKLLEIGKVSTGLKEKEEEGLSFVEMTRILGPLVISEKGREVKVKAKIIIEVAYEEIQSSPTYNSGYALRFPRVVRLRTDEMDVEDISSLDYVEKLYNAQKS